MRNQYKNLRTSNSGVAAANITCALSWLNDAISYSPIFRIITSGFATNAIQTFVLGELAKLSERSDEFKPTPYAISTAKELIGEIYSDMFSSFPKPSISPDGDGGILLDWVSDSRSLRLVIPDTAELRVYIYHQNDREYDAVYDASGDSIRQWLTWLMANERSTRRQPSAPIDVRGFAISSAHR